MARKARRAYICCIMVMLLLPAALFNGVCLGRDRALPGRTGQPSLVALDVCNMGAPGAVAISLEGASNPCLPQEYYFPSISVFPPEPDKAVASAEPGETEKPPKS